MGVTFEIWASISTIYSQENPLSVANAKSLTLGHITSSIFAARSRDEAPSSYNLSIGHLSLDRYKSERYVAKW